MGCVVVDDGVDFLSRRHLRLDVIEESDELLVPVALHIAADDGAVEDVERHDAFGDVRSQRPDARGACLIVASARHRSSTCRSGA